MKNSMPQNSEQSEESYLEYDRLTTSAMIDNNPQINIMLDENATPIGCNAAAVRFAGAKTKAEFYQYHQHLLDNVCYDKEKSVHPITERFYKCVKSGHEEFNIKVDNNGVLSFYQITMKKIPYRDSFCVSCYISDTTKLVETQNVILGHEALLNAVVRTAEILMSAQQDDFDHTLAAALNTFGVTVKSDRVSIWRNYRNEDGELFVKRHIIYMSDTATLQKEIKDQSFYYRDILPQWDDQSAQRHDINCTISDMPNWFQQNDHFSKIKSMLFLPINISGEFWGFFSLSHYNENRKYSLIERDIMRSGGVIIASSIIRQEITQSLIEAKENALASIKAKNEFLSRMSHEIRTPLNAIAGMTILAQKSNSIDNIKQNLKKVESASNQLLGLINDVLDMSKIDANKMIVEAKPFDLKETITNLSNTIRVKSSEKEQFLDINFDCSFDSYVISDRLRIEQLLTNLLGNAIKFTPVKGHISLRIFEKDRLENHSTLIFEVADNGIGIDPSLQDRVFSEFEQGDGSITRKYGGSGLGLSICKKITEIMGGGITVQSEQGKGSTFTVTLPVNWGEKIKVRAKKKHVYDFDWSSYNILLVEDNELNQEIVHGILKETGVNIDFAENGEIGVKIYLNDPLKYSLIFMDIQMPVMDGLSATRKIRSSNVQTAQTIPIIAMTANAFKEDRDKCYEAGMNGYVAKPFNVNEIYSIVKNYLGE